MHTGNAPATTVEKPFSLPLKSERKTPAPIELSSLGEKKLSAAPKPLTLARGTSYYVAQIDGKEITFEEQQVSPDGNCGFTAMGTHRAELRDLFIRWIDSHEAKDLDPVADDLKDIGQEIKALLMEENKDHQVLHMPITETLFLAYKKACKEEEELVRSVNDKLRKETKSGETYRSKNLDELIGHLIDNPNYKAEVERLKQMKSDLLDRDKMIDKVCAYPAMFKQYVENGLAKKVWLGYRSAKLFAKLKNYNLYIFTHSPDKDKPRLLILKDRHETAHPANTFYIIHTSNYTHFNVLSVAKEPKAKLAGLIESPSPTELKSPTSPKPITYTRDIAALALTKKAKKKSPKGEEKEVALIEKKSSLEEYEDAPLGIFEAFKLKPEETLVDIHDRFIGVLSSTDPKEEAKKIQSHYSSLKINAEDIIRIKNLMASEIREAFLKGKLPESLVPPFAALKYVDAQESYQHACAETAEKLELKEHKSKSHGYGSLASEFFQKDLARGSIDEHNYQLLLEAKRKQIAVEKKLIALCESPDIQKQFASSYFDPNTQSFPWRIIAALCEYHKVSVDVERKGDEAPSSVFYYEAVASVRSPEKKHFLLIQESKKGNQWKQSRQKKELKESAAESGTSTSSSKANTMIPPEDVSGTKDTPMPVSSPTPLGVEIKESKIPTLELNKTGNNYSSLSHLPQWEDWFFHEAVHLIYEAGGDERYIKLLSILLGPDDYLLVKDAGYSKMQNVFKDFKKDIRSLVENSVFQFAELFKEEQLINTVIGKREEKIKEMKDPERASEELNKLHIIRNYYNQSIEDAWVEKVITKDGKGWEYSTTYQNAIRKLVPWAEDKGETYESYLQAYAKESGLNRQGVIILDDSQRDYYLKIFNSYCLLGITIELNQMRERLNTIIPERSFKNEEDRRMYLDHVVENYFQLYKEDVSKTKIFRELFCESKEHNISAFSESLGKKLLAAQHVKDKEEANKSLLDSTVVHDKETLISNYCRESLDWLQGNLKHLRSFYRSIDPQHLLNEIIETNTKEQGDIFDKETGNGLLHFALMRLKKAMNREDKKSIGRYMRVIAAIAKHGGYLWAQNNKGQTPFEVADLKELPPDYPESWEIMDCHSSMVPVRSEATSAVREELLPYIKRSHKDVKSSLWTNKNLKAMRFPRVVKLLKAIKDAADQSSDSPLSEVFDDIDKEVTNLHWLSRWWYWGNSQLFKIGANFKEKSERREIILLPLPALMIKTKDENLIEEQRKLNELQKRKNEELEAKMMVIEKSLLRETQEKNELKKEFTQQIAELKAEKKGDAEKSAENERIVTQKDTEQTQAKEIERLKAELKQESDTCRALQLEVLALRQKSAQVDLFMEMVKARLSLPPPPTTELTGPTIAPATTGTVSPSLASAPTFFPHVSPATSGTIPPDKRPEASSPSVGSPSPSPSG